MAGQPASIHADQSAADPTTAATDAATSLPPASSGSPSEPAGGPDSGSAVQPQPHVSAPAAQQHPASDEGQPPAEQPAGGDPADQPKRDQAEASLGAAPPAMPPGHRSLAELGARLLFEKVMTTWDMSGHGRIVVPKMAAATSMPQLEERNGFSLDIDAVDTCGARHPLTFRSQATGGRDRVWQLEGLREVQAKYGIALGNILVVSQLPDGTMCLSGRPGRPTDAARKPPRKSQRAEKKRKVYDAWAAADASSSDTEVTEGSFFEPLRDGVYRAVPGGPRGAKARSGPPRVTEMYGTWTAVIDLAGEAYQAFFRNADSARESYNAATQHLNLTPSQHATP